MSVGVNHMSVSKNHKNALYVILTPPLAGEESNKFNMLQMRMHSYEFEILRAAAGGTKNDIFRQAHTVHTAELWHFLRNLFGRCCFFTAVTKLLDTQEKKHIFKLV